jgi:hypothetical protein
MSWAMSSESSSRFSSEPWRLLVVSYIGYVAWLLLTRT